MKIVQRKILWRKVNFGQSFVTRGVFIGRVPPRSPSIRNRSLHPHVGCVANIAAGQNSSRPAYPLCDDAK